MGSICDSVPVAKSSSSSTKTGMSSIPPFLSKTYDMVDDRSTDDVVSWSSGNNSFVVWNVPEFAKLYLPKYFKHNNFSSFVRQLNTYGFRKVDPDRWEFANEDFLRGQKQRLKSIVRRKPSQVQPPQQPQVQHSSVGACTEVGNFGLEEEVDRLKRDKNVLMQELVRLRQQQLLTEHHLQNVGQKVHVMEQRQQQMMSFLAKAVQSPGFINQFSQQQHNNDNNGNNHHISESNKKRRLPVEEAQKINALSGQQMVKYQEAYNHGGFCLGDVSNSNASDKGSSSSGVSGATLADVSSNPGMRYQNQVLETNLPYSRASKQGGGSSGSPTSDNGECFDPIMAVLDGSMELNAMNDLLDVTMAPKVPEVQDSSVWEQFFGVDTDELIAGSVDNELIMEQLQLQSNLRNQQMYHLTEQMGLLRSDAIFRK